MFTVRFSHLTIVAIFLSTLIETKQILAVSQPDVVTQPIEFVILITSYNNEKYAFENLKSVCHQRSTNPYHVVCINDCSSDKTAQIMNDYVAQNNLRSKVTLIHNKVRVGALENIYNAIQHLEDHKIVVSVDGDDTLVNDDVLLRLEKEYQDPYVWMTYGSARIVPHGGRWVSRKVPTEILRKRKLRSYPFVAQHLRTFKVKLFKKIDIKDLLYEGKFFKVTWDIAFMWPMLEMCAPTKRTDVNHSRYIKDILYLYRMDNPLNDFRINKPEQTFIHKYLAKLPGYEPINSL